MGNEKKGLACGKWEEGSARWEMGKRGIDGVKWDRSG